MGGSQNHKGVSTVRPLVYSHLAIALHISEAKMVTKGQLANLYFKQGFSTREVAKVLGFKSKTSVLNLLKKYGMNPRSSSHIGTAARKRFSRDRRGSKNKQWRGGIFKSDGYIRVLIGLKKYKQEHRVVMEKHLGRKLKRDEFVHHINEDRSDNRIENLQVCSPSEHTSIHNIRRGK